MPALQFQFDPLGALSAKVRFRQVEDFLGLLARHETKRKLQEGLFRNDRKIRRVSSPDLGGGKSLGYDPLQDSRNRHPVPGAPKRSVHWPARVRWQNSW